jgi:hypothetical protein
MKKHLFGLIVGLLITSKLMTPAAAQEKIAQTGLQFLSVISDARAAALAGTMTGVESQSSAMFFNPAAMSLGSNFFDVSLSRNEWIADISHYTSSFSIRPAGGNYGVFGFSVQYVDYGAIQGTRVALPTDSQEDIDRGYVDTNELSTSAFAIGFGYAKMLSDRFGVGGQVKWARQSLGESVIPVAGGSTTEVKNRVSVVSFDFGTIYQTGIKSLAFGFSVRNFSEEIEFAQESFQLPLVFSLGISMNLMDLTSWNNKQHSLLFLAQATNERSHAEQVSFGLEYKFINVLTLRGGYITNNDEDDVTFGFGVSSFGLQLDYAYTPFGVFDKVQRFTMRFSK